MGEERPRPSEELIGKVRQIVGVKSLVKPSHRGGFTRFGLLIMSRESRARKKMIRTYRVSGRIFAHLVFKEEWDDTANYGVTVKKYKPGDWEEKLDRLYEYAEDFRQQHRDNPDVFTSDTVP